MMKKDWILITGCSTGIGRCLALGLYQQGFRVIASARKKETIADLQAQGLYTLQLDLDDSHSIQEAVTAVVNFSDGRLYALINNGAYGQPGAVEDLSREVLRKQFETNVFGSHELTNALLPLMRRQQRGRIIQISSLLAIGCLAYRGAYNASKYALEGLSDTLRLELRGTNIHVVLVQPGPITSKFRENAYAAYKAHINRDHSAHRSRYITMEKRLAGQSAPMPFTLPPEAVLKKVTHALGSGKPRAHYRVTVPATLFEAMRRLLPTRWRDVILARISDR